MERNSQFEYKDRLITLNDFSSLSNRNQEHFLDTIKRAIAYNLTLGIDQLVIADVNNTYINTQILDELRKYVVRTASLTKRMAVYGLSLEQMVLVDVINLSTNRRIRGFEDREEALGWLISIEETQSHMLEA